MNSLLFSITLFAVLVIIPSNELCYSSRASYALSWYCSWDLVKPVEFYRVEGMYMCGYTFACFFVRDPVPCLIFLFPALCSHLAFHLCYCRILGPFCLRASGHRLSFVDTMSLIACRFVLRACFYVSPFSTPFICRIKLVAYFSTLGSSQIPISSIIPLSKGEENQ